MSTTPSVKKYKLYVPPSPDTSSPNESPSTFAAAGLTGAEILDGLFEDETTVGLELRSIVSVLPTTFTTMSNRDLA
jgi:hypothetical protein